MTYRKPILVSISETPRQCARALLASALLILLAGCSDTGSVTAEQPNSNQSLSNQSQPNQQESAPGHELRVDLKTPMISDSSEEIETAKLDSYFFDVMNHSQAEVNDMLERTREVYENLLADSQNAPEVTMVLHGPDVQYFASSNYANNRQLVDLAAKLDAFGYIDLKVCATATELLGIAQSDYPKFIEVVPYGPAEIARLQQQGAGRLNE